MSATLVLAVDDDLATLKLVEITLSGAGYAVLAFDNARDALEDIESGLRPDVIISDVSMPGLDGFAFYRRVRMLPELRSVPFIFLTALGTREHIRQGMATGADDYLTKPFARKELIDAVSVRLQRLAELRRPLEGNIKIVALGQPLIERNGERLNWDSIKALELLFYLLEHRSGVTTFEVAEALWPGKNEAKASSSFHTTLFRLRKVIGGEIVESANRRYYLHDKFDINYDVENYRVAYSQAQAQESLEAYKQAARLYTGAFLAGTESPWVEELRDSLHFDHLALLSTAAEHSSAQKAHEASLFFYEAMAAIEPYSDTAWEGMAAVWEARGDTRKAATLRQHYQALMSDANSV